MGAGPAPAPEGVRLQRVLAVSGIASRRACEAMIAQGRVSVNDQVVRTLPVFVDPEHDRITVDGRPLAGTAVRFRGKNQRVIAPHMLYIMLYKPERVVCTTSDDAGRKTVLDLVDHPRIRGELASGLGGSAGRVFPVGRLDFHAAGLVLLTNDGELTHRLTHPSFGIPKTYEALVKAPVDEAFVRDLEQGLNRKHRRAAAEAGKRSRAEQPVKVSLVKRGEGKSILRIELHETGARPLEDLLAETGCKVARLTRTALGPLTLTHLALGAWRELERDEIYQLRKAAGLLREGRSHASRDGQKPARPAGQQGSSGRGQRRPQTDPEPDAW